MRLLVRKQNNLRNMPNDFHQQQALAATALPAAEAKGNTSLLPFDANMDSILSMPSIDIQIQSMDSMLQAVNQGGGALGGTMDELGGRVVGHLGAPQAEGDNVKLEQMASGDLGNLKAPSVQGDLQLKEAGMGGAGRT